MQASCEHLLFDIVSISILAMACGADDWTDLETFGNKRREWLATLMECVDWGHGSQVFGDIGDTFRSC